MQGEAEVDLKYAHFTIGGELCTDDSSNEASGGQPGMKKPQKRSKLSRLDSTLAPMIIIESSSDLENAPRPFCVPNKPLINVAGDKLHPCPSTLFTELLVLTKHGSSSCRPSTFANFARDHAWHQVSRFFHYQEDLDRVTGLFTPASVPLVNLRDLKTFKSLLLCPGALMLNPVLSEESEYLELERLTELLERSLNAAPEGDKRWLLFALTHLAHLHQSELQNLPPARTTDCEIPVHHMRNRSYFVKISNQREFSLSMLIVCVPVNGTKRRAISTAVSPHKTAMTLQQSCIDCESPPDPVTEKTPTRSLSTSKLNDNKSLITQSSEMLLKPQLSYKKRSEMLERLPPGIESAAIHVSRCRETINYSSTLVVDQVSLL
ncbi:hypothetical protein Ciccas_013470 [Cichlidogyrus casuarinus]|uniref:Uncharacterized protein n=1 Tax=Cichlidogyrus casuarinus TaxID=1844966 RepID=A0ABD2PLM5_9PLAT